VTTPRHSACPSQLPYEYAIRSLPDAVERCVRCKGGFVHRRGPDQLAYCPRYVRADVSSATGTSAMPGPIQAPAAPRAPAMQQGVGQEVRG